MVTTRVVGAIRQQRRPWVLQHMMDVRRGRKLRLQCNAQSDLTRFGCGYNPETGCSSPGMYWKRGGGGGGGGLLLWLSAVLIPAAPLHGLPLRGAWGGT